MLKSKPKSRIKCRAILLNLLHASLAIKCKTTAGWKADGQETADAMVASREHMLMQVRTAALNGELRDRLGVPFRQPEPNVPSIFKSRPPLLRAAWPRRSYRSQEVRSLAEMIAPASEHVLGWFHITMRIMVLRQFAQGLENYDEQAGQDLLEGLRKIKWHLWHGNGYRARDEIADLQFDAEALETDYPNMRKFLTTIGEFRSYVASNKASLINYGERYRSGEHISSAFVEATVNAVISKRFAKKQQMQWSKVGAHLRLQPRTQTLDGSLRRPSSNGTRAWQTTIKNTMKQQSPPDRPTNAYAPIKGEASSARRRPLARCPRGAG